MWSHLSGVEIRMRFPEDVCENLGIDEEAEYGGHFSMEAVRLFLIFDTLKETPAVNVRINLDSEKVVFSLDGPLSADQPNPALMTRAECFHNPKPLQPESGMVIQMEDQVENVVCWICLKEYVRNNNAVHRGIWNRVYLYMGEDVQTAVIQNRVPGVDFLGLIVPGANHIHDVDDNANEDGHEGGNGNAPAVIGRKRARPGNNEEDQVDNEEAEVA